MNHLKRKHQRTIPKQRQTRHRHHHRIQIPITTLATIPLTMVIINITHKLTATVTHRATISGNSNTVPATVIMVNGAAMAVVDIIKLLETQKIRK